VLLVIALPFAFLWWYTDWSERSARKQRRIDQAGTKGDDFGRSAGRLAGNAYVAGKRAIKKRSESES
jgi:hypothetical protein